MYRLALGTDKNLPLPSWQRRSRPGKVELRVESKSMSGVMPSYKIASGDGRLRGT